MLEKRYAYDSDNLSTTDSESDVQQRAKRGKKEPLEDS
jgi:hypothetical protein